MTQQGNIQVEVFADIPFRWVLERDSDAAALAKASIAEFVDLSGSITLNLWNERSYPIQIEAFQQPSDFKHFAGKAKPKRIALPRIFVRLSSKISYTPDDLSQIITSGPAPEITAEQRVEMFSDEACSELHAILIDLYLAASIASPGSFYFWESWMFVNCQFLRGESGAMTSFDDARKRAMDLKWPPLQTLKILDVYSWLQSVPGFTERRGLDRVGRAIAALSYLVKTKSKDDDELALVWALVGLEALYGTGNVGLKSQLLEKSEAFLGSRQENKKQFGRMYDFRSRLIHGDLDLLYQHNTHDAAPAFEDLWDQIYECEELATAMLLATLQKLCLTRTHSLEFAYTLE